MWLRTIMNDTKKGEKTSKGGNVSQIVEIFVLISASLFLSVVSALFMGAAGAFCAVAASALFACALFLISPTLVCLIAAAVSAAASFLILYPICGNAANSLAGATYAIVGALIYFGVKRKWPRTKITVGAACFLTVFCIFLIALYFLATSGSFSLGMLSIAFDAVLTDAVQIAAAQLPEFLALPEADKDSYILEFVKNMKALSPALFVMFSSAMAYLSTSLFRYAYNIFIPMANPGRKKIKGKYWRLNLSLVSAVAAIISISASFFVSPRKYLLTSIVFTNLAYILAPGFCVMGLYFVHDKLFKQKTWAFCFALIPCAIVFALYFQSFLYIVIFVLAMCGLHATLAGYVKKLIEKAKKVLLGDDDDTDDDDYIE